MADQSENKVTITSKTDEPTKSSVAPTKAVEGELSEQALEKATGGITVIKRMDSTSPKLWG